MDGVAYVNSLNALQIFKDYLPMFQDSVHADINQLNRMVEEFLGMLEENRAYWQREFELYERSIRESRAAIMALLASNYLVPVYAYYTIPGYLIAMQRLTDNQKKQKVSREKLELFNYWIIRIKDTQQEFLDKTNALKGTLGETIPGSINFLANSIGELQMYIAINK